MSMQASPSDLRHQFFDPKGFDITNRAVPAGYAVVPAGQLVQPGDIWWSRAWGQWTLAAAVGVPANEGHYYRKEAA
jgi:hypothetical protein